jgi:hypothetical protein
MSIHDWFYDLPRSEGRGVGFVSSYSFRPNAAYAGREEFGLVDANRLKAGTYIIEFTGAVFIAAGIMVGSPTIGVPTLGFASRDRAFGAFTAGRPVWRPVIAH